MAIATAAAGRWRQPPWKLGGSAAPLATAPRQEALRQRGDSVAAAAAVAAYQQRGGGSGSGQRIGSAAVAGMAAAAAATAVLLLRCRIGDEDTGGNSNGRGTDNNQQ